MAYLIAIFIDLLLIALANVILVLTNVYDYKIWLVIVLTYALFALMIGIEALIAWIIHRLPAKVMDPYLKRNKVFSWERRFYEATGIKTWKKGVPDTGQLCDFKKDELKGTDTEYLYKFLVEACYADKIHFWMGLGGFLVIPCAFFAPPLMLSICLPMAIISLVMNFLPMFIQRYNRPKLMKVYERNLKKEQKNKELGN